MLVMAAGLAAWAGCTPTGSTAPKPGPITPAPSTAVATGAVPTLSPSTTAPPLTAGPEPTLPYSSASASAAATGSGHQIAVVRVGSNASYDRIVVEFSRGSGRPWWRAAYVAQFSTQGEGRVVPLPGAGKLQLIVGVAMPEPSDTVVRADQHLATGTITGVYVDPFFEGQAQVLIGVDAVRPYRVFVLDSPTRVVVDFQR